MSRALSFNFKTRPSFLFQFVSSNALLKEFPPRNFVRLGEISLDVGGFYELRTGSFVLESIKQCFRPNAGALSWKNAEILTGLVMWLRQNSSED